MMDMQQMDASAPAMAASPDQLARRAAAVGAVQQLFGSRCATGAALRGQHAHTLTWLPPQPPDVVVFAETAQDLQHLVAIASRHRVAIIPFGAGSSLEGQVNAPNGGISIDFSRMNRILAVNAEDLDVEVEPGVTRKQLNEYLRDQGLFFPIDPGADFATLGGMAATRASGTTAVRYGTMKDNVLAIAAVMANGCLIRTTRRARKSAAGYDLTRLLVGSEGTLALFSKLTLKVYGIPESILAAVCPFASLQGACNTVIEAIQLAIGVARVEVLDELQVKACNAHSRLGLEEVPTLFVEFHGSEAGTRDQVERFGEVARSHGARRFDWAANLEDRNKLWKARHDVYWSVREMRPGCQVIATDIAVPISRLAECVLETRADIDRLGLIAPIVGHVGDGNFHVQPLVDVNDSGEMARIDEFLERLAERALRMDGTTTGEHGIGQGKRKYLDAEHGAAVAVMRSIKQALDPLGIFNPGKIFPGDGIEN